MRTTAEGQPDASSEPHGSITPFIRAAAVWLVLMAAEAVNGTLRQLLVVPRIGDLRARQVGVLAGSAIIVAVVFASIRWIRARASWQLLVIGAMWVLATTVFELVLGRFVFGYTWDRLKTDYDIPRGGLLPLGMLVMGASPLIAARIRRVPASDRP